MTCCVFFHPPIFHFSMCTPFPPFLVVLHQGFPLLRKDIGPMDCVFRSQNSNTNLEVPSLLLNSFYCLERPFCLQCEGVSGRPTSACDGFNSACMRLHKVRYVLKDAYVTLSLRQHERGTLKKNRPFISDFKGGKKNKTIKRAVPKKKKEYTPCHK